MSDQAFEKSVGEKLRNYAGTWSYHPPDDQRTRQWKPGDFIFGHDSHWGVIECKETQGETFAISKWPANQRLHAETVTAAGGTYWLLVRFMPSGAVAAFHGALLKGIQRGSLKAIDGRVLNLGRSFVIEILLATRPVGSR